MTRKGLSSLMFAAGAAGLAAGLALGGCSQQQQADFNAQLITTTQNVVALNNALIQVNKTLIDNFVAQQKELAPYSCGAYTLAAAIIEGSPAASKVNAYLDAKIAAGVANVAVKDVCSALGYPTTVSAPAGTPAVAAAPTS